MTLPKQPPDVGQQERDADFDRWLQPPELLPPDNLDIFRKMLEPPPPLNRRQRRARDREIKRARKKGRRS